MSFTRIFLFFRFMKMSSPKLNILISLGGIILNVACLMYGMDYFFAERYDEATVTCQVIVAFKSRISYRKFNKDHFPH